MWMNYTGSIGIVHFTNGVSDGLVPEHVRRRLSIGMQMVEIDADGNEEDNSATSRLLDAIPIRASVDKPSARQTPAEKSQELLAGALAAGKQPAIYTKEELEKTADKQGIKGVREIAEIWDVRHRSIPTLINMILDAQERFLAQRKNSIAARVEQEVAANDELRQAALSGDLSAAIKAPDEIKDKQENDISQTDTHAVEQKKISE